MQLYNTHWKYAIFERCKNYIMVCGLYSGLNKEFASGEISHAGAITGLEITTAVFNNYNYSKLTENSYLVLIYYSGSITSDIKYQIGYPDGAIFTLINRSGIELVIDSFDIPNKKWYRTLVKQDGTVTQSDLTNSAWAAIKVGWKVVY